MSQATHITSPRHYCAQQHALSLRTRPGNQNHHLWNNNGTWYIHYTVCEPGCSGTRRRESLNTRSVVEARSRRNQLLAQLSGGAR